MLLRWRAIRGPTLLVVRESLSLEMTLEERPKCYLKAWSCLASWRRHGKNLGLEGWEGFFGRKGVSNDGKRYKIEILHVVGSGVG